jgi:hypothetical protein
MFHDMFLAYRHFSLHMRPRSANESLMRPRSAKRTNEKFIVLEPTTPKQETTCKQNKTKQNKAKQSKASPFHSAFDLVLDVQIRSSAIIGGGNGENMRLSTSESLFQRSC